MLGPLDGLEAKVRSRRLVGLGREIGRAGMRIRRDRVDLVIKKTKTRSCLLL